MERFVSEANIIEPKRGFLAYWEPYRRLMENPPVEMQEYFDAENRWLSERVNPSMDVLDVGSGNGRTMLALADRVKTITGIDYDERMVEWSKESVGSRSNTAVLLRDAYNTGLADESFDLVVGTFNFLGNPNIRERGVAPLLAELTRLTKPGGKLMFSMWTENSLTYSQKLYTEVYGYDEVEIDHAKLVVKAPAFGESQRFTPTMITEMIKPLGYPFTVERLTPLFYIVEVAKPSC